MKIDNARLSVLLIALAVGLSLSACSSNQAIDPKNIEKASRDLEGLPQSRCLLVERDGTIASEEYFHGGQADAHYDVRSVTKSVMSLLIGIAVAEGKIKSLDQTVGVFLSADIPDLDPAVKAVTVRQLLTMTSGLPWRELNSVEQDYGAWISSPDPLLWILKRPLDHPPGTYWHYNTGACHILSAILTQAVGRSARDYAQERLFTPLGETIGGWPADPRGNNYGGHGIGLTPRALIKLGRLMLDKGVYRGKQIVPESWVTESTAKIEDTGRAMPWGSGYGYLWWTDESVRSGSPFFFATGYGGQFIVCVPSKNAVVAAVTDWYVSNAGNNWYAVMNTIATGVLPGLR